MKILDTTIRDGSYAIDFKFSCKDVQNLVEKAEKIGIEYIEIGHGQGLNASSPEHGIALQSDEEYMKAARKVAGKAKLGFFVFLVLHEWKILSWQRKTEWILYGSA
ncbi:hypothetical protein HMPREF0988_01732 [Lachnospiraceae bacterium 1_4_56FAA]|nr:hypothetical protein HMPREF0988_01732 [Lachnospiraceae bacterium 1_4_56FAA]